jgi:hypothetical protein
MPVTISSADLSAALKAVRPFVANDTLPTLNAVRIEAEGRTFTATATDRYTVAHARKRAVGDLPPTLIPRVSVLRTIDFLREQAGSDLITVSVGGPGVAFEAATDMHRAATIDLGFFPHAQLAEVAAAAGTRETSSLTGPIGLNPRLLARVTTVAAEVCPADMLRLYFTDPAQAVRIEVSDWLLILIMLVHPAGVLQDGSRARMDMPNVPFGLSAQPSAAEPVPA